MSLKFLQKFENFSPFLKTIHYRKNLGGASNTGGAYAAQCNQSLENFQPLCRDSTQQYFQQINNNNVYEMTPRYYKPCSVIYRVFYI
jgi:hypothetical protein